MVEARLLQQPRRPRDGTIRATAIDRHDVGRQRVEEQRDVGHVIRQRRDSECIVGEDHEAEWIRTEFARKPLSPGVAAVGCGVSIGIIKARPGEDPRQLVRRAARSMRGQKRRRSSDPR